MARALRADSAVAVQVEHALAVHTQLVVTELQILVAAAVAVSPTLLKRQAVTADQVSR
jgi:hypothetical protein